MARKRRYAWFFALYIEYIDRKARNDAPGRIYMSATIHKISHNLEKRRYTACTHVRDHTSSHRAPLPPQRPPAWPWATAWPDPTRPEPPRSRPWLLTAAISRPRDRPRHVSSISAREAASRRLRRPRRASRARHARLRRCCWRHSPRRPPARAYGGCCGPAGPPGGPPRPARPAPLARGGGAVAPLRSAPARQTGRGESRATRGRVPGGAGAAEKSSQVKSSQVKSVS